MTESALDIPSAHIRGPADLVELIPYLLGFHPTRSVVVAGFQQWRERLTAVIRIDSPAAADAAVAGALLSKHLRRGAADGAVIVIYGDAGGPPEAEYGATVARDIGAALGAAGIQLCDALWVAGGRWRSYLCWNDECCPPAGNPVPAGAGSLSATATLAGLTRLPDRQTLVATLRSPPKPTEAMARAMQQAVGALAVARSRPHASVAWRSGTRERFRRAIVRARGGGPQGLRPARLTDNEVARLLVGLTDVDARDACWRVLEIRCSAQALAVCWQLAQRSLPPYRTAPLFLLGWTAWRRGDGALARIAVEQALQEDARYGAALLLLDILDHGIHPDEVPRLAGAAGRPPQPRHRR